MKNSGIEWIGEIPDDWKVGALKYFYSMQTGFTPSTQNDNYYDDESGMIWVTISDITNAGKYIYDSKSKISKKYLTNYTPKITPSNSLLYSFKLSIGTVAFAGVSLYTNEAIASFIKTEKVNLDFLYYSSFLILYNANTNIYGAKLLNQDLIRNAKIIFPPLSTQQKIADYLDKKCAAVDRLIENQRAQIEKLKEYKQSVITEAVTRGLDPSAPMKDSGVGWIGDIPKGWEMLKMVQVCDLITDYVASGSFADLANNVTYLDYPNYALLVRTIDVSGKGHNAQCVYINKHAYDFLANSNLYGGELLFPNIGASVGDVYIVPKLYEKMSLAPNSIMVRAKYNNKFIYYYFSTTIGRFSLLDIAQSTAQPKFNKTDFRQLKIIFPEIEEQRQIVDYLDKKCAEIDKLIAVKQQKIETLTQYKKSLIYEYVTGKKEVRAC